MLSGERRGELLGMSGAGGDSCGIPLSILPRPAPTCSPVYAWNPLTTIPRRTTLEKQLAADALTPDTLKARQLLGLGRRESK